MLNVECVENVNDIKFRTILAFNLLSPFTNGANGAKTLSSLRQTHRTIQTFEIQIRIRCKKNSNV